MPFGRTRLLGCLVLSAACVVGLPSAAVAAPSGGLEAGATPSTKSSGGTGYGKRIGPQGRPVARDFRVAPSRVTAGGRLPSLRVRFVQSGATEVSARMVLVPLRGQGGNVVRVVLGKVPTGRTLRPGWPAGTKLAPGRYVARVHAADTAGHQLRRVRGATGKTRLTVLPPVATPKPAPTPTPLAPVRPEGSPGTFPVAGPHSYGDGFGGDRGDHRHEGVDISAAQGVANVAPTAGTIRFTDYQASGAGEYVVMRSVTGPDYFFAHCVRGSTKVRPGQAVTEGQPLCALGSTGRSTGSHLHFEIWPNGWRTGAKNSVPVDPLPQLKAWDR